MRILGINTGHDGHVCVVENGRLIYSHESEKDDGARYAPVSVSTALDAFISEIDDLTAISFSGWAEGLDPRNRPTDGGYLGLKAERLTLNLGDRIIDRFHCSHELSHLVASYALSPFADTIDCYGLLWEGHLGNFYKIHKDLTIELLGSIMEGPGVRYAFAYGVADPTFKLRRGHCRLGDAGKMMALTAYSQKEKENEVTADEEELLSYIMDCHSPIDSLDKAQLTGNAFYNIGVRDQSFCNFTKKLSNRIFQRFLQSMKKSITESLPLVVSGGCGLNCEWNRRLERSGVFTDVFVPPCTNDTGVGIGAAAIAQHMLTGKSRIEWSVYAGQPFIEDCLRTANFFRAPLDIEVIAQRLAQGEIVCWAQGNCEIGPRALGNRSIISPPFSPSTTKKLNSIKNREDFRPVAPICLEQDASDHFEDCTQSKFMLSFYTVKDKRLKAITHVDGSARVQTITASDNPIFYDLLTRFKSVTGVGVLCNTSLNNSGRGFINRLSDLETFCLAKNIQTFVVNNHQFTMIMETP